MSKKISGKGLVIQLTSSQMRIIKTTLGSVKPSIQARFIADLPAGAVEDGVIRTVTFTGGCAGNTQGVARLLIGMTAKEAVERLSGIRCGFKPTSCPDQVAEALRHYLEDQTG